MTQRQDLFLIHWPEIGFLNMFSHVDLSATLMCQTQKSVDGLRGTDNTTNILLYLLFVSTFTFRVLFHICIACGHSVRRAYEA